MRGWLLGLLVAAAILVGAAGQGWAALSFVDRVQGLLYAGRTAEVAVAAQARLDEAPDDDQVRLMLGAVEFNHDLAATPQQVDARRGPERAKPKRDLVLEEAGEVGRSLQCRAHSPLSHASV